MAFLRSSSVTWAWCFKANRGVFPSHEQTTWMLTAVGEDCRR